MKHFLNRTKNTMNKMLDTIRGTIEIANVKKEINIKERETQKRYTIIGESVYRAYAEQQLSNAKDTITFIGQEIIELQREVSTLHERIESLRGTSPCEHCIEAHELCPYCYLRKSEVR